MRKGQLRLEWCRKDITDHTLKVLVWTSGTDAYLHVELSQVVVENPTGQAAEA